MIDTEPDAETGDSSSVARARATAAPGLIPQPHGGALRPFTPATGSAAARSSMRSAKKRSLELLREASPEATQRLIALLRSPDDRVSAVAAAQILDRALGKPSEASQVSEPGTSPVPIRYLTPAEQEEAFGAIETIERLTRLARARAEASEREDL